MRSAATARSSKPDTPWRCFFGAIFDAQLRQKPH
jgi:hypothetical protein